MRELGNLQHAIMRVLWERGEASASQVHAALLEARGLALTTIKTMLRKMEERAIVAHRTHGRRFIYRAAVTEHDVRAGSVSSLVERVFDGSSSDLVNHLIESGDIDADELKELSALLARKRRES